MGETSTTVEISFRQIVDLPSTTHATFGIYRYPAKFIPHVVAYVLENYTVPGMKVFDPFAGCGTVGVAARVYGCDYELWDLNPMLRVLHSAAVMDPVEVDVRDIISQLRESKEEFLPQWSRLNYWFPAEFIPLLSRVWGYYHSPNNETLKLLLALPLLKTTRYFSYDDTQRQKLSKSPKSQARINKILQEDWENLFFQMLSQEISRLLVRLKEYKELDPKPVNCVIRAGVDVLGERLTEERDILITSPPYLQSQEYIRQAKLDLFWLGYSEEEVKKLAGLEIPYRNIEPHPIYSETFAKYRDSITDKHVRKVFDQYFWGILGAFTVLQEMITKYLFIFVGHTSMRGKGIPLDVIIAEHLSSLGWKHEKTLADRIVSRRLFSYRVNPATGLKDARTPTENLVILRRS